MTQQSQDAGAAVKTETNGDARPSRRATARHTTKREAVPLRQWPDGHRRKGGHVADAICIDSSDDEKQAEDVPTHQTLTTQPTTSRWSGRLRRLVDDDDDDTDEDDDEPLAQEPTRHRTMARIVDEDHDEDTAQTPEPAPSVNAGKRKAWADAADGRVDKDNDDTADREVDASDDASIKRDATEPSEASTTGSVSVATPLLAMRNPKKQKVASEAKSHRGAYYKPTAIAARKSKSNFRDLTLMSRLENDHHEDASAPPLVSPTTSVSPTALRSPITTEDSNTRQGAAHAPAQPTPNATHARGIEASAQVKQEPPNSAPESPPSRPSRDSRAAASPIATMARPSPCLDTLFESPETRETTVRLDDQETYEQRSFTFSDITSLCEKAANAIPEKALFQALYDSLTVASETVVGCSTTTEPSSIDFIRSESSERIELKYPDLPHWSFVHEFPMTMMPESPQFRALRERIRVVQEERDAARHERDAARRERDTLTKQVEQAQQKQRMAQDERDTARRELETCKRQYEQLQRVSEKATMPNGGPAIDPGDDAHTQAQLPPVRQTSPKARRPPQQSTARSSSQSPQPATRASQPKPAAHHTKANRPVQQKRATMEAPTSSASTAAPHGSASVVFHALGEWMRTGFMRTPGVVTWNEINTVRATHITAVPEHGFASRITVDHSGSYRLSMTVTHSSLTKLGIVITSAGGRRVVLHPHLIQIAPSGKSHHSTSQFDEILHFDTNDTIMAEVQLLVDSDLVLREVQRLDKLIALPNEWRMELIDSQPT